jgi:hypothetical protein
MFVGKTLTWAALELLGYTNAIDVVPFQCKKAGCTARFHKAKGYCVNHYMISRSNKPQICEHADGCDKNAILIDGKQLLLEGKAYCGRHYNELFKPIVQAPPAAAFPEEGDILVQSGTMDWQCDKTWYVVKQ